MVRSSLLVSCVCLQGFFFYNNKDILNVKLKPPVGGSKSLLISD